MPSRAKSKQTKDETHIDNITIVGGGDAGLMAALLLDASNSNIHIKVIDDFSTPPSKVGKSTYTAITDVLHNTLDINEERLISEVKPVWKVSAFFEDWCGKEPFHLPFDKKSILPSESADQRFERLYYRYEDQNFHTLCTELAEQKKLPTKDELQKVQYDSIAYHLNTGRFNNFLKDLCREKSIELINDRISDVDVVDNNIKGIKGEKSNYQSDLYVDATGFSRLLMQELNNERISFDFPIDSALVTKLDIPTQDIVPATVINSGNHGWFWQIDTFDYRDIGYVYSSDHVSYDKALEEFAEYNERISESDVRHYTFDSGVYRRAWVSNCVAIGNALGFVEPLTATALTLNAELCEKLSELLSDNKYKNSVELRTEYNRIAERGWDNIYSFIRLLYKYPSKDNEFWKEVQTDGEDTQLSQRIQNYHQYGFRSHYVSDDGKHDVPVFDQWDFCRLLRNLGVESELYKEADVNVGQDIIEDIQQVDQEIAKDAEEYLSYSEVY